MDRKSIYRLLAAVLLAAPAAAQSTLLISRPVEPHQPFTVAGPRGAILGRQDGSFEAWLWPVKVLSHFRIEAELYGYPVPIDLAPLAAHIEVTPASTVITYSHAAFTVRQRMFAPRTGGAGALLEFEIDSVRPLTLTFRFEPEMLRMWPAANPGRPSAEWETRGDSGFYILHTDDPNFSAAVGMFGARSGVMAPYQERPQNHPLELKLAFDPKKDSGLTFPLLLTLGDSRTDFSAALSRLAVGSRNSESDAVDYWSHFFETRLTAEMPDRRFDDALRWAEVAIDQGLVRHGEETGLVAGYYESGDSARPGFGWFFGRDSLWTSYAANSYGDPDLTRAALEFLIRRQREDGKIMHEFSQTAELVDWKALPYFYASADATPLFVMAMDDYVQTTADTQFLKQHWDAVRRAYAFTRAHDSDGDGVYENTEGTGWVESWVPAMPHQEIYLAALDQQSADGMSRLAALMGDDALARSAHGQSARIASAIESEYFDREAKAYAFSRNADGTLDRTFSIYPAVAWWNGSFSLPRAGEMFSRWASTEISTDWGTRDISTRTPFYDSISYHQGTVWPLFTGWVSLAEYRAGRPLAGYAHLMQNADLTWAQDSGAVTELLSGEFFQPLGRSSSHQIWSSAMVLTPALRGLFGLCFDAPHHTLRLAPNLPATWDSARLRNVTLGPDRFDLEFRRNGGTLEIRATSAVPIVLCLAAQGAAAALCHAPASARHELSLPLPAVELEIAHGLPTPGSPTSQLKVISEERSGSEYTVELEAPGGSAFDLPVRMNRPGIKASARISPGRVRVEFPQGAGFQRQTVRFSW